MIGRAIRSVGQFIGRTVDDVVEIGEDIASDAVPVAVKAQTLGETVSMPLFLLNAATQALARAKSEAETRDTTRDERIEEKDMPHVEGHMPIEIPPMQGQIRYESPSEAFVGGLTQAIPGIVTNVLRGLRGPVGSTAGGLAGGAVASQFMGADPCGCQPKPFVRYNKCGDPIITRKMKKQAIEAINCNGPEMAAATLTGGDLQLLTAIVSKQFPPQKRGISGAQLSNAAKTARRLNRMHMQFQKMCKTPTRRSR
tara:strand:- start:685 stop:1446 length:762 start_codon:yes stop_codon:yes gene_type:complete